MLNRMFKWLSTGSDEPKKVKQLYDWAWNQIIEGKRAHDELVAQVTKLSDELQELRSEHRKLRGRFYQARGELEPERPATREAMKASVYSALGYIPGKPAPHKG